MDYETWKKKYLFAGETPPIYFTFINFLIFTAIALLNQNSRFIATFSIIGMISSYAVFTDLYAHLWTPKVSDISLKDWFTKFMDFRTHDVYGVGFTIVAVIGLSLRINSYALLAPLVLSILTIYYIIHSRFYH